MANYSHDRIVPFKDSTLGKKQQIAEMFDRIAFRYDFLNRFLSGGSDIYWRRQAIRALRGKRGGGQDKGIAAVERTVRVAEDMEVAEDTEVEGIAKAAVDLTASENAGTATAAGSGALILDVATGTADMAILMTSLLPGSVVTGVDISSGMLEIGRQKVARLELEERITLQTGDGEALPFTDEQFDAVTVAFGVRNFENLEKGLREMLRVLKPGGKLVVLEFSKPRVPGIAQLYNLYLCIVAPRIGKIVSKNREAYQYLNNSVRAFPEGEVFLKILDTCGYLHTRLRRLSLGICSLYIGEKAGSAGN